MQPRPEGQCHLVRKQLKPLIIKIPLHSPRFKPWAMKKAFKTKIVSTI